jgi:hypothetical protein
MMLQQHRSIQLPLVGVLLLGLLVGAYLVMAARKRLAKADDAAGVVRHSVDTSAEDTLKYWTQEKMRKAKPAKMPRVKKVKPLEDGKKRPKRPPV